MFSLTAENDHYLLECLLLPAPRQAHTQPHPGGVPGVQVMCNVGANGGIELDREFGVEFGPDFGAHQIRLEGGDCSTDSFCYPSA